MNMALDILGLAHSEVVMVGDLYDTDILSGIHVGIDTLHVQTGVTSEADILTKEIQPTYTVKDLNAYLTEL